MCDQLPRPGRGAPAIYDAGGSLVRTLAPRAGALAREAIAFDGRDDAGRRLASGVYFVLIDTDAGKVSRRITIVR